MTSSHPNTDLTALLTELGQEFGSGHVHEHPDPEDAVLAAALLPLRSALRGAFVESGMSVRGLAALMAVSPSVLSRFLNSEGDMKVSTAALVAHYLGKVFKGTIEERATPSNGDNFFWMDSNSALEIRSKKSAHRRSDDSFTWQVAIPPSKKLENA